MFSRISTAVMSHCDVIPSASPDLIWIFPSSSPVHAEGVSSSSVISVSLLDFHPILSVFPASGFMCCLSEETEERTKY